nr:immunoglobulin light chain junction region [Macaca mulatta]MOX17160.1 immunoglobulin light chain junction region [Macaca mulatta]MOX17202.1 immunoglobulin light chain junction region [Macaca mulatta]MOX17305.1 immunoglobulin light chain junction region [Macaca mulatta]MOX17316.1 immunoglobulin light chain junction region [Macaca mulatta]
DYYCMIWHNNAVFF